MILNEIFDRFDKVVNPTSWRQKEAFITEYNKRKKKPTQWDMNEVINLIEKYPFIREKSTTLKSLFYLKSIRAEISEHNNEKPIWKTQ
jgi:hypothetical protein